MRRALLSMAFAALLLGFGRSAHAQFGDLFNRIVPPSMRASAPAEAPVAAPAAPSPRAPGSPDPMGKLERGKSAALADGAPPAGRLAGIRTDLPADRQCTRPQENFNVMEKAAEYGGTEASLRLERLIQTDMKHSDLDPKDREMLQYIAQTTVWVPVEVEGALAGAFEFVSSRSRENLEEAEEITRQSVEQRLDRLRAAVPDFPRNIRLVVDPKLADGASAKFGGVIHLSGRFMEAIAANPAGGDLVLAHELSHVYKRHAIKLMQYRMISTEEGWELAKKLLSRAMQGTQTNVIQDGLFMMTTTPKIVDFVRSMHLKFTGNQELEADACAVVWLRAIGVDPSPAWDEFESAFATRDAKPSVYGSTHPPTADRRANYKAKVSGKPSAGASAKAGKPEPRHKPLKPVQ
jgi:hypothetical protein